MSSRGSEWHKWDLHVHTPDSNLCYKNRNVTNQDIINSMAHNDISVFAITDHHYININRYQELADLGKPLGITVLPGIEFLAEARGREPVHYIGIFSEKTNLEFIWGQIKNKTAIANTYGSNPKKRNEVYCDIDDTIKLIKSLGGITTIHAGQKSNSVENITNALPHTMAQKTDLANLVDIYELGQEKDQEGYRKFVFPTINREIPMILCSDNHNALDYTVKQNCWIKGSPNFEGLKYALNEPEERFFIGSQPDVLTRLKNEPAKFLDKITINRVSDKDQQSIWFEHVDIPLNPELITIIGNKGSGKSALADITALCADGEHSTDYTFLDKDRFKKKGLADRFAAQLTFRSGSTSDKRLLDHNIDSALVSRARYLPQSYFEKVCNEIDKTENFRAEIEKVVFQYIPAHDRLGQNSFSDLLEFKKQTVDIEIATLKDKLSKLNTEIIKKENLLTPEFQKEKESALKLKQEELQAHLKELPKEVIDPKSKADTEEVKEKRIQLDGWEEKKEKLNSNKTLLTESLTSNKLTVATLSNYKDAITDKIKSLNNITNQYDSILKANNINAYELIHIKFNNSIIDNQIQKLEKLNRDCEIQLSKPMIPNIHRKYDELTLNEKIEHCKKQIKTLSSEFSTHEQSYITYSTDLNEWKEKKEQIKKEISLLSQKLNSIKNETPNELITLKKERIEISKKIYNHKAQIKSIYDYVKSNIDEQLQKSNAVDLSISSSFSLIPDFSYHLLSHLLRNKTGSFYSREGSKKTLQEKLIAVTCWNSKESVANFQEKMIYALEHNINTQPEEKTSITDLVRDRKEFYDYLFGLDYLISHYDLSQNGKSLAELSPGEKGALLLVFYLVLDKEDVPLIIDQPEDNLDNKSVAEVLVPFIKEAKKRRQIIMVTHNPNLAVVADSEQVIRVSIEKENGNKFSYVSGGIEKRIINDAVVDVLEGTLPAFTKRKDKYRSVITA